MEGAPPPQSAYNDDAMNTGEGANGIPEIPSLFFGNLDYGTSSADIRAIFEQPLPGIGDGMDPIEVERVDLKRGFCFVYLKQDFKSVQDRDAVYNYAQRINGMHIDNVSKQLRAEFARGDGRVKRKEESRRGHIEPNETLFVVNYNVDRTRREDLEMLFKDYGRLVRVDMRRNYAFVQFESTEDAIKAKDATDGGKLDDSVLSVEFVVSKRRDDRRRSSPSRRGRYDDYDHRSRRSGRRSRSRSYGRGRYRSRSRSPRRRRSRSRSRSRDYGGYGRDRRSRSRSRDYGRDRDYRDKRSAGGGSSSDRGYRTDDRGYGSRPI